ncbi:MAG: metallophosphoesterase family protein [Thaumarchaeota archaeon]|nr:metallophosphoesterase family protein [Nitrososphaerota archaeon]
MLDLVFSDIHADIGALDAILGLASSREFKKKYGEFSRILNLGDVLERGMHPAEVLARLKSLQGSYEMHSVMGNHDEGFLYGRPVSASSPESLDAHAKLTADDLSFFKANGDSTFGSQEFVDKKHGLFCVHGGPLDPGRITPKDARDDSWLYQRSWQRLTSEDFEFFTYAGYHYRPDSAFSEAARHVKNHVILCGHQHQEEAVMQDGGVRRIYHDLKPSTEKISGRVLESREIIIEPSRNYLVRLGIGGPEGHYVPNSDVPHFAIVQHDPRKVVLFAIRS